MSIFIHGQSDQQDGYHASHVTHVCQMMIMLWKRENNNISPELKLLYRVTRKDKKRHQSYRGSANQPTSSKVACTLLRLKRRIQIEGYSTKRKRTLFIAPKLPP